MKYIKNKMPIEKSTVLDDVIIMIIDIAIIANHLTKLFFEKRKKGISIIIVIAKSFGFHWNPVGGCIDDGIKNESRAGCNDGSLPKKVTIFENGDIGSLNVVKDSNRDSIISIQNAKPAIFKALRSFSFELKFINTVNTIATPQKI